MAVNAPVLPPAPAEEHPSLLGAIRARILSGLFLALPLVITGWIIYWLYTLFRRYALDPFFRLINYLRDRNAFYAALPEWWDNFVAPVFAVLLVLVTLYLLGLVVRSRVYRTLNWILLRVPVVTTIYQAVNGLFVALENQRRSAQFKRVVLVEFPQPGMRSLGLVTNTLRDSRTGRRIVCVCVLTGVMPPTGFTLFVPEESVTDIPWTLNQALQAIVSGGITTPETIRYFADPTDRPGSGPRTEVCA